MVSDGIAVSGVATGRAYARPDEISQQEQIGATWYHQLALPVGVAFHRTLMCVLAIALLWSTSLALSLIHI